MMHADRYNYLLFQIYFVKLSWKKPEFFRNIEKFSDMLNNIYIVAN